MPRKRKLRAVSKKELFDIFAVAIKPKDGEPSGNDEIIAIAGIIFGLTEIMWEQMEPVSD